MALTILVDGYNLIAEMWGMGHGTEVLARQRTRLLAHLAAYRAVRRHPIHVVFDGWREGDPAGSRSREAGIDVTFSPRGITADEVLRDLVQRRGPGTVVVSSDRRVARWAAQAGADPLDAATFSQRMDLARQESPGDGPVDTEDDDDGWDGHTVKRGNPRRRSKRDRKRARRVNEL